LALAEWVGVFELEPDPFLEGLIQP
jgi:hypothetical protein